MLTYEVFVAPPELTVLQDRRPGGQYLAWSPTSATLIMGERDVALWASARAVITPASAQPASGSDKSDPGGH